MRFDRKRNVEWGNLLLALGSIVLSLLVAELAARIRFFGADAFSYTMLDGFHALGVSGLIQPAAPPELLFELEPDLDTNFKLVEFRTNSAGLRDDEYPLEKPSGTFRVAVVGDSFTMGAGVPIEQVYHSLLEAKLRSSGSRHYEFINFGVGGYSLRQYAAVIRHKVLAIHPDLIVLGWCGDNDHEPDPDERHQQPYQVLPVESGFFSSYLLWWAQWAWDSRRARTAREHYSPAELRYIRSNFDQIRTHVRGIPVVVVQLGLREKRGDLLRELATQAGFRFVDTAPEFAGLDFDDYFFHELDAHPNARANRVYADVMLRYLQQMGIGTAR